MVSKADIAFVRSLSDKRSRQESGLFVAEGRKIIEELVASDFVVTKVYTTLNTLTISGMECEQVSPKEMERLSHLKTPTDYLALARIPRREIDFDTLNRGLVLALDDVQDPGNVGTIIRIADWFGVKEIICSPSTADCFNPKVVQATMGALLRVKMHYCELSQILSQIETPVYGTFLEGENIYHKTLSANGVIVMGNEGRGISQLISQSVTDKLCIPPYPQGAPTSESLNVATATAIICSEFRRR